jgi:uncharacterized membrane protein YbhN (UPF0104 family)
LTVLNYLVLTGYDFAALAYAGKRLPAAKVMAASLLAFAISHTVSFACHAAGLCWQRVCGRDRMWRRQIACSGV